MSEARLEVGCIVSAPFDENTYIAHFIDNPQCIVIDPGLDPDAIFEYLAEHSLTPAAILCTHGHSDHIAGNAAIKGRWPEVPLVIGHGDAPKLTSPELNLSAAFGIALLSPPADLTLREGDKFTAAGLELDIYETPGHSSGHVVYLCRQFEPWHLFGGDVLFRGSIGRTDFPDGDFDALVRAIHEKLFTLPDETFVLSGHGPRTTIGREKHSNPFVGAPAGYVA